MSADEPLLDDEQALAELFDQLLEDIQEGREPELDSQLTDRPHLQARIRETYELACAVGGRREPSRPILGGYEILRELGRGGMGTVYLARHEQLGREVAIKVLPQSLALSPKSKRRFLEEARALARLRHDHVVHIHRIVDDNEMLAFEMEHVDGPSLQALLSKLRPLGVQPPLAKIAELLDLPTDALRARSSTEFFVKLAIAIARALGAVHRSGLVHRDVKPSNILLRKDGRPLLADFGLARDGDLDAAQTIAFAGTPIYAAPERLRDGDLDLDGRADIYSLGVTLYEAVTMTPPYQGRSTNEILRRIESGRVVPLRTRAPHVSRDLQTVLIKAMEPDLRHRYLTADAFADDLERLLNLEPVHARPVSAFRRASAAVRRHRRVVLAGIAGAVLVGALMFPVIAHAQTLANKRQQAVVELELGRQQVLAPASLGTRAGRTGNQPTVIIEQQVAALEEALQSYDRALEYAPAKTAGIERAVVATVLWLRQHGPTNDRHAERLLHTPELQQLLSTLPPVTKELAQQYGSGRPTGAAPLARDHNHSREDRFAAGLLALLLGDLATCERAWDELSNDDNSLPLLDAGLGLVYAADGFPERAFPRLYHAVRSFPNAPGLARELADAALAMGEPLQARQWLEDTPAPDAPLDSGPALRRRRMHADVLAAEGQAHDAAIEYRKILRLDPRHAVARHRLAMLAMHHGDLDEARRLLERILLQWPGDTTARLDIVRLALHRGDRREYLHHAELALAMLLDTPHTRGTAEALTETLRLGHLLAPIEDLLGRTLQAAPVDTKVTPATDLWRDQRDRQRTASGLLLAAQFRRASSEVSLIDARPLAITVNAAALTALRCQGTLAWLQPEDTVLAIVSCRWLIPIAVDVVQQLTWRMWTSLGDPVENWQPDSIAKERTGSRATQFGAAMALSGLHADGDRRLWIAKAATGPDGAAGLVQVRSLLSGELLHTIESPQDNTIFGMSIANVGDINDDEVDDFAIGAPRRRHDGGKARVFFYCGRTFTRLHELSGEQLGFGVSIASLGDIDDDGYDDLAVGASPVLKSTSALGAAYVFSGRTGQQLFEHHSDRAGVWFGAAVANAGDIDGDGLDDLVVGGNHGQAAGLVRVYSSATGNTIHTWSDENPNTSFGRHLAGLGDINGDGLGEILVTATGSQQQSGGAGSAHVYEGHKGALVATVHGESPRDAFGFRSCRIDNWAGNGRPALAIAATRGGLTGGGYVRVFDLATMAALRTFYAPQGKGAFGFCLLDLGIDEQLERSAIGATVIDRNFGGAVLRLFEPDRSQQR